MNKIKTSKKLQKIFGKCVREYDLINENDKIVVGFSGGKDSITLLHLIKNFKRVVPFEFEYTAVTVDYGNGQNFDYIINHCKEHGISHVLHKTKIAPEAENHIRENSSFCSYFSRMRRGALYSVCQELGFNKLALGHHLDDAVESFFMNMFYNGSMRTLAPKYKSKYDIEVIRPLIFMRETLSIGFAKESKLETIGNSACPAMKFPIKMPYARAKTKKWLNSLESEHENLFKMLQNSFSKLHADTFFDKNFH